MSNSKTELNVHFVVYTVWVNDNAFLVRVDKYHIVQYWHFFKKRILVDTYEYGSWENFMSTMWKNHLLKNPNKTTWDIDSSI